MRTKPNNPGRRRRGQGRRGFTLVEALDEPVDHGLADDGPRLGRLHDHEELRRERMRLATSTQVAFAVPPADDEGSPLLPSRRQCDQHDGHPDPLRRERRAAGPLPVRLVGQAVVLRQDRRRRDDLLPGLRRERHGDGVFRFDTDRPGLAGALVHQEGLRDAEPAARWRDVHLHLQRLPPAKPDLLTTRRTPRPEGMPGVLELRRPDRPGNHHTGVPGEGDAPRNDRRLRAHRRTARTSAGGLPPSMLIPLPFSLSLTRPCPA